MAVVLRAMAPLASRFGGPQYLASSQAFAAVGTEDPAEKEYGGNDKKPATTRIIMARRIMLLP